MPRTAWRLYGSSMVPVRVVPNDLFTRRRVCQDTLAGCHTARILLASPAPCANLGRGSFSARRLSYRTICCHVLFGRPVQTRYRADFRSSQVLRVGRSWACCADCRISGSNPLGRPKIDTMAVLHPE